MRWILVLLGLAAACVIGAFYWDGDVRSQGPLAGQPSIASLPIPRPAKATYSPDVRVNLTSQPVRELQLAVDGPFEIRAAGARRVVGMGEQLARAPVTASATGIRIGRVNYAVSRLEIVPGNPPALWVDGHQYRGVLRLYRRPQDRVLAVNVVSLEDYIASVVDSEMPAAFPQAARRAQAIVARSYALDEMQTSQGHPFFDLFASTRSQKYLGVQYRDGEGRRLAGESAASRHIVRETAGMVATFQGRLFRTYYGAVCGGRTMLGRAVFQDAAAPLQSVVCDWCRDAGRYRWSAEVPRRQASAAFQDYFAAKGQSFRRLRMIGRNDALRQRPMPDSGKLLPKLQRVPEFQVGDGESTYRVSAVTLRRELFPSQLDSPFFVTRLTADRLIFEGRGHGHAVGLCQWGARGQALKGRNCLEIVRYYYPGSKIVILGPPQ